MSYGTLQDTPPAAGRAKVRFAPDTLLTPASSHHPDEDDSTSDTQNATIWERTRSGLKSFYNRNFGLFLVFLAQSCGSIMNLAAKLLANDPSIKFHALQIIFIRMISTSILCSIYCWYHNIPDFPFGKRGIRWLLVLRGSSGFVGLFGIYYSLSWLEFSDATVITFLVPTMTAIVCFLWLREPFTWKEAVCSLVSFVGVLFVARPTWLFPHTHRPSSDEPKAPVFSVTPEQRALAIVVAIIGTLGASLAYSTIRVIGKRAHSLVSVNCFGLVSAVASSFILLVHPDLHFTLPTTALQWLLIAIIGLFGFLLQFLLTEGLQREKGGRATNLMYLQLVFALVVERVIWGTTPPVESLMGAALIIAAAIAVSLQKQAEKGEGKGKQTEDEETRLLQDEAELISLKHCLSQFLASSPLYVDNDLVASRLDLLPVQRYAQRLLRSHESALRTRGFSRTPPQNAQHGDDKGSDRPAGMSNLEWMQLQHYQRWRKKLMEDPYQTLFGASNDMLNGKGLKDWEWISNSFPKWMLREMGGHEDANPSSKGDKDTTSSKRYSKKVEIENDTSDARKERESYFPQPTPRAIRISGDDSRGIISPSDLRRPRENPEVTVIGKSAEASIEPGSEAHGATPPASAPQTSEYSPPTPPKSTQSFNDYIVKTKSNATSKIEQLDKTHNERGASFMDGFLSKNPHKEESEITTPSNVSTWKETTLQRRLSQSDVKKYKASNETSESTPVVKESENASSTPVAREYSSTPPVTETSPAAATHEKPKLPTTQDINPPGDSLLLTRSTSETLSRLPENDIDFLSAADIRASMGMKKSKILSDEQRKAERENLEKSFTDAHVEGEGVDPMIESKVINDQLVRRIERRMQMPDEPKEVDESQPTTRSGQTSDLASETQIESSIERMRSWLEQGGAIFSNYFWQDPTEEADAKKTRLFFDKVLARIRKGRSTMKQVIEDLETDIPSSKPLLKRMKADEDLLDSAIHALRQRSGSGKMQPLTPKKVRAIQSLRLKYQDTDSDLNKAYAALQEIDKSDGAKNMPLAFKQRLGLAAKIIQKNAHLTRYLIWSLQARLEDPDIDPAMLPNYKAVANSLLTLRDTQMALSRLVDRAMLVYCVVPQSVENVDFMGQTSVNNPTEHGQTPPSETSASVNEVDKAQLRAKIAAEERLANEVDAQKSAMRGLSDDGYVRESKKTRRKSFEERSPLDHSLYRPFGYGLSSLGSDLPLGMEPTKLEGKAAKKYNDAELVTEIQKAYEDTYGSITAGHMQMANAAEGMKQEQESEVKKFDMLKEDPTAPDEASEQASITQMPETQVKDETVEAVTAPQAVQDDAVTAQPESSAEDPTSAPQVTQESATETSSTTSSSSVPITDLPTNYTILIHDAETNTLSLTTSTSPPPRDAAPSIPLHTALSTLSSPSKFIPYITPNLEVVTAKPDMLILRDVPNPAAPPSSSHNVMAKPLQSTEHSDPTEATLASDPDVQRIGTVNPIDGTTRLSPTGYVGPAENREQLEKEFEERRRAAEQIAVSGATAESGHVGQAEFAEGKKRRSRGRSAGVVKTAIWAAATCYVVGVVGELVG